MTRNHAGVSRNEDSGSSTQKDLQFGGGFPREPIYTRDSENDHHISKNNLCLRSNSRVRPGEREKSQVLGKAAGLGQGHPWWEDQGLGRARCWKAEELGGQRLRPGANVMKGNLNWGGREEMQHLPVGTWGGEAELCPSKARGQVKKPEWGESGHYRRERGGTGTQTEWL